MCYCLNQCKKKMATINNSATVKEITEALKVNAGVDKTPTEASGVVQVTLEANPRLTKPCDQVYSSGRINNVTTPTLFTTPTKGSFYLTWAAIAARTGGGGICTIAAINITVGSRVIALIGQPCFAASVTTGSTAPFIAGNHPIKIDKNTAITLTMDAANASDAVMGSIAGFMDEND